jgi:hypothetical protein
MFKVGDRVALIHLHRVGKERRREAIRVEPSLLREPQDPEKFAIFLKILPKFASECLWSLIVNRASRHFGERYERGLRHGLLDDLTERRDDVGWRAPRRDDRSECSERDVKAQFLECRGIGCESQTAPPMRRILTPKQRPEPRSRTRDSIGGN